jgi:hypothetical protein
MRAYRWVIVPLALSAFSPTALAASTGWDGTWSGAWGGQSAQATSITVASKRVVSYEYQGMSHRWEGVT